MKIDQELFRDILECYNKTIFFEYKYLSNDFAYYINKFKQTINIKYKNQKEEITLIEFINTIKWILCGNEEVYVKNIPFRKKHVLQIASDLCL